MCKRYKIQILLIICFVFAISSASARSLNEVIQSMKQRAPAVKKLKSAGIVGENNKGYLSFIGSAGGHKALVLKENKDRKATYKYIARKENTSLSVVEARNAKRKADKARSGEFFQNPSGSWIKK